MTSGPEEPATCFCPRCKGLMVKPSGSPFYWHADNNHPRCDITNLAASPVEEEVPEEPFSPGPLFKGKHAR